MPGKMTARQREASLKRQEKMRRNPQEIVKADRETAEEQYWASRSGEVTVRTASAAGQKEDGSKP